MIKLAQVFIFPTVLHWLYFSHALGILYARGRRTCYALMVNQKLSSLVLLKLWVQQYPQPQNAALK